MAVKIEFTVPTQDRRRKNFKQIGRLFDHRVGSETVAFVHQDNGDVAHYATGGLVLKSNSIKARKLALYVADPYGPKYTDAQIIARLIDEIDPDVFFRVVGAHPVLNT